MELPSYDMSDADSVRRAVAARLQTVLREQIRRARGSGSDYVTLLEHISQLIGRGGKRLRPLLAVWSYAGFGGHDAGAILRAASALEIFHAGILMHDDIIDADTVRWGGQNIGGMYRQTFSGFGPGRAAHLADAMALLAGDICITLAYEQILLSGFSAAASTDALECMYNIFFSLLGGELSDVTISLEQLDKLSTDTLLRICEQKTATYSFGLPLELGARLAGANEAQLQRVRDVSAQIGIAYQLQDDVLGMFGDSKTTGKSMLSDIREGKRTMLIKFGFEYGSTQDQAVLRRQLGNAKAGTKELEVVRSILKSCGAKAAVEQLIADYYQKAQDLIPLVGWNAPFAERFQRLAASQLGRQA